MMDIVDPFMPELRILGQAIVASVLGGVIGWERETAHKGAGLRTLMLICLASMVFVKAGQFVIEEIAESNPTDVIRADPMRILEAVVTGISFIGAGLVFRDPRQPVARGLTTAATLLVVALIGIAVAVDRYVLATGMTIFVLIILRGLNRLEAKYFGSKQPAELDNRTGG